jgi:hypothetical protein
MEEIFYYFSNFKRFVRKCRGHEKKNLNKILIPQHKPNSFPSEEAHHHSPDENKSIFISVSTIKQNPSYKK